MSIADVDICNLACAKLGAEPIVSITDNNPRSAAFNRTYAMFRDKLLRTYRWSFTTKYAELAALATVVPPYPAFEYAYAYPLPDDCLSVDLAGGGTLSPAQPPTLTNPGNTLMPGCNLSDWNNMRAQDYRVVGKQIWTNFAPSLNLIYRARITDPNQFDASFTETLACYLAYELCYRITGSLQLRGQAQQEYLFSLKEARGANAIELPPESIPDDTWMFSRLGS